MDLIVHDNIPADKMRRFHEILVATGGRYLYNPLKIGDSYMVDYAPGNYEEHGRLWQSYIYQGSETRPVVASDVATSTTLQND